MRITYLHQYFNTPAMAGSTRSYEMARRLVAMGHQVNMVSAWRAKCGHSDPFNTDEAGINVTWVPVPYSNHMNNSDRVRAFLRFAWKSAQISAKIPSDAVFATSTPLTIALPGVIAARFNKVPLVFEVRDLWPEIPIAMGVLRNPLARSAARGLEQFAYRHSSRIVALSPGMKEGIAAKGYPPDRISVIPNSADIELFGSAKGNWPHRQALPPGPVILYAGTLGRVNGVDYLVRTAQAALCADLDLQFIVVGDGQEASAIRAQAQRLGVLARNFHMFPPVPKSQVPEIFAAADVAVSLVVDVKELWANSANKFFDALAAGVPIAVNYGGWQAELLSSTGAGIVLPVDDPGKAAKQLQELVEDRSRLERARLAARSLAIEHFDRDKLAAQLETVLVAAVEEGRSGRNVRE